MGRSGRRAGSNGCLGACPTHPTSEQGLTPLFVNTTAGTSVFGAYDPLPEIAEVCKRENL